MAVKPAAPLPPSGRRPLIAGNWKMNYTHLEAIGLTQKLAFSLTPEQCAAVDVVILPPFISIRSVQTLIDGDGVPLRYGAQDLSPHDSGAYTGDVSGPMLAKLGCGFVIVGHSERREYHHETDEIVHDKLVAAFRNGLTPILCVGESLAVREAGEQLARCRDQLGAALQGIAADQVASIVVAYEPIWAIGTGEVATPEDAQEVCAAVRAELAKLYSAELADGVRVLYGGSVKAANAPEILGQPDIDGALVGGASLDPKEFSAICVAAGIPAAGADQPAAR
ncbi:triose-phosphate isomerase [uncultured Jatrophihabitans sp.]|uniref:triose-phosphate isomerase n=1 Tax=uncultured Jatrophihabitans sp. TaxID=1610747 RepID=UPI0035C96CFF